MRKENVLEMACLLSNFQKIIKIAKTSARTQPIVFGSPIMKIVIAIFLKNAQNFQQIVQNACLEKFLVQLMIQLMIINVT